jgi:hypothetical protein
MAEQLLYVGYHALGQRWPGKEAAARHAMHLAIPATTRDRVAAFLAQHGIRR